MNCQSAILIEKMKKTLLLTISTAFAQVGFSSTIIDFISIGGAVVPATNDPAGITSGVNSITPETFSTGGNTFTILDNATVTGETGNASNIFFGNGRDPLTGNVPVDLDTALSDGDILTGRLNGQNAQFQFSGITQTDVFAIFFRGATFGFAGGNDQSPRTVQLLDSTGVAISNPLALPAAPAIPVVNLGNGGAGSTTGFARASGNPIGQVVGGFTFNASDFVFIGTNTFTDAAALQFPETAAHDPTEVFRAELVPEPSISLLGALSALLLTTRRRR